MSKLTQESYISWAWTLEYVAAQRQEELQQNTGLLLPGMLPPKDNDEACLVHFNALKGGQEYPWIWLFYTPQEALALRLLQNYLRDDDPVKDIIAAALPTDKTIKVAYPQIVPIAWFKDAIDLESLGIKEVWIGFDYKKFRKSQGNLQASAQDILSADEFKAVAKRA